MIPLPLVLYLLVFQYGYWELSRAGVVTIASLPFYFGSIVIADFEIAVMNFAALMGEVTYLVSCQNTHRLYFLSFFSILFCGLGIIS